MRINYNYILLKYNNTGGEVVGITFRVHCFASIPVAISPFHVVRTMQWGLGWN